MDIKTDFMKIDMHTHCLPISLCAHHQPEEIPKYFLNAGIDAIVLTNHCYPNHCDKLSDDLAEQAEIYVDIFQRCEKKGVEIGLKVFFGSEIKLINETNKPEFLLYGISEDNFLKSYPLYNLTQKELFEFCNKRDILMVQSHPFRKEQGYFPADMRYMHGVEVYNPHLLFPPRFEEAFKIALDNDKLKTSGSDFHIKDQAGLAGMIIPDEISNQFMLRDYLKTGNYSIFNTDGVFCENK